MSSPDVYTHGHHESVLRSHRWRTAENSAGFILGHLTPSTRLLDVGCGPGTITADLARLVPQGEVVGLDRSEEVIDMARSDHVAANLTFRVGDVYDLDVADGSFDVVYSHQVLQHLSRPVEAIAEMGRALRPGGLLALRDADFGTFTWFPSDPWLSRWNEAYHQLARGNGAEPDGGRHVASWAREAGFRDVAVSTSTWTYATPDARRWWGDLWADRVTSSDMATQFVESAVATPDDLEAFAAAFRRWAAEPDGLFVLVNFEVLARR